MPFDIDYVRDGKSNEFLFVSDQVANKIIKFDMNFKMIKAARVNAPRHLTSSTKSIYVNSNRTEIIKFDLNLNEQKRLNCKQLCNNPSCCELRGIHYNADSNRFYIVNWKTNGIYIFDSDLNTQIDFIDLTSYKFTDPYAINSFNGELIVGGRNQLLAIRNAPAASTIYSKVCSKTAPIETIYIYKSKFILVNCFDDRRVNILNLNLTKTVQNLSTSDGYPKGITSDGKRLLVTTLFPNGIHLFS
jgi:hypothetical protein